MGATPALPLGRSESPRAEIDAESGSRPDSEEAVPRIHGGPPPTSTQALNEEAARTQRHFAFSWEVAAHHAASTASFAEISLPMILLTVEGPRFP